jgi:transcriptional regulator with GAF, ATPase, and Fis domain
LLEAPGELRELLEHALQGILGEPACEIADLVQQTLRRTVGDQYAWPGNVRELEQAVRRILLTRDYAGSARAVAADRQSELLAAIQARSLDADALLAGYCALLYQELGSFEAVARQTKLDRRTVKKYMQQQERATEDTSPTSG